MIVRAATGTIPGDGGESTNQKPTKTMKEEYPPPYCNGTVEVGEEPSVLARLATRKNRLLEELKRVDDALEALQKNPEIGDALTKIGRAIGRL